MKELKPKKIILFCGLYFIWWSNYAFVMDLQNSAWITWESAGICAERVLTFDADAISRCVASAWDWLTTSIVVVKRYKCTPSPYRKDVTVKSTITLVSSCIQEIKSMFLMTSMISEREINEWCLCYSTCHAHLKKEST